MLIKKVLLYASTNLPFLIPLAIGSGLLSGFLFDLSALKACILPLVMILIYPSLIGIDFRNLYQTFEKKVIVCSLVTNFILVPLAAYVLGIAFLKDAPGLFAGLALTSLLPTSSMTVTYTMLAKGNVRASLKITVMSLIIGSLLCPPSLYLLVGRYVPIDLGLMFKSMLLVILIPLCAGVLTFNRLKTHRTKDHFEREIKPFLPGVSACFALLVISISVGLESRVIFNNLGILVTALSVQAAFYLVNYILAVAGCRWACLDEADSYTLVYTTALRNLGISIGLAATALGYEAALMASLAFLIQPVAGAWFVRLNKKYGLLASSSPLSCRQNSDLPQ